MKSDLSAILECVKAQYEWINKGRIHVGAEGLTGFLKTRTELRAAVIAAQKKAGLGG
jgi:hypothetical protein